MKQNCKSNWTAFVVSVVLATGFAPSVLAQGSLTPFKNSLTLLGANRLTFRINSEAGEPGICPNDSKLLNGGPTSVFGEGPDTWWGLVTGGLVTAGIVDEEDQIAYLNNVFGTDFDDLDSLKAFNLQLLSDQYDKNQNGYVCAYELRGTRAYLNDPYVNLTYFAVSDDRIKQK